MSSPVTFDLPITGMTCASCAGRVERALRKVPGVQSATVNLANERAHVEVLEQVDPASLIAAVDKAGYGASLAQDPATQAADQRLRRDNERWHLLLAIALALPLVLPMLMQSLGVHCTAMWTQQHHNMYTLSGGYRWQHDYFQLACKYLTSHAPHLRPQLKLKHKNNSYNQHGGNH